MHTQLIDFFNHVVPASFYTVFLLIPHHSSHTQHSFSPLYLPFPFYHRTFPYSFPSSQNVISFVQSTLSSRVTLLQERLHPNYPTRLDSKIIGSQSIMILSSYHLPIYNFIFVWFICGNLLDCKHYRNRDQACSCCIPST